MPGHEGNVARVRVLVVDDSVVVRQLLAERLGALPGIEVVGTAVNGRVALAKLAHTPTDVMILDVDMPEMDGLATLRELRRLPARPRVIMFSAHTTAQAKSTIEALSLGAEDCVAKPSNLSGAGADDVLQALADRIRSLGGRPLTVATRAAPPPARVPAPRSPVGLVAIGASTGGPNALCQLFSRFPGAFPVPVVLVQHMPASFTRPLADRLMRESNIVVEEGAEGALLAPGKAVVAPGGRHMVVRREGRRARVHLHDEPPVCSCRPSVDVLFASVAATHAGAVLGVVMTGMGEDGRVGSRAIRDAGGSVIVQDAESSVVWGMAGSVVRDGLADAVLPLDELGDEIVRRVRALG